jgi:hypothetical protein
MFRLKLWVNIVNSAACSSITRKIRLTHNIEKFGYNSCNSSEKVGSRSAFQLMGEAFDFNKRTNLFLYFQLNAIRVNFADLRNQNSRYCSYRKLSDSI